MSALKGRCLIDTNILIYATLEGDPRFQAAQAVLLASPRAELFVSVQNLAEMYPNLTGPKMQIPDEPEIARAKIKSLAGLSQLQVLPVTQTIVAKTLELCAKYRVTRQRYFDLQLVSVMLEHEISVIVTENDRDFASVSEVKAVNPFR